MSNNVPLPKAAVDSITDPLPHNPPAGDWRSHDAEAIASYFQASDLRPLVFELIQAVGSMATPKASRLISVRVSPSTQNNPAAKAIQALPRDDNRQALIIQVTKESSCGILVADESFTPPYDSATNNAFVYLTTPGFHVPVGQQLVIPNYTGAVFVAAALSTGTAPIVDIMGVSS
jgi:hypothetical protein